MSWRLSLTSQGRRDPGLLAIDERQDTWGNPDDWLAFERRRSSTQEGTDLWAIYSGPDLRPRRFSSI